MHAHTHTYTQIHTYIQTHIHADTHTYKHTYTPIRTHTSTHTQPRNTHIQADTPIQTHIHAHTSTHTRNFVADKGFIIKKLCFYGFFLYHVHRPRVGLYFSQSCSTKTYIHRHLGLPSPFIFAVQSRPFSWQLQHNSYSMLMSKTVLRDHIRMLTQLLVIRIQPRASESLLKQRTSI